MEAEKGYVVEWRIENFSHWLAEVHGDCIKSPKFYVDYCSHMELYPKGIYGQGEHLVVRFCAVTCYFSGELSFYSSNGSLLCSKQPVNTEGKVILKLPAGPKFEDVLLIREGRDFITVRCLIRQPICYTQRMFTTMNVLKVSLKMNPSWIEKMKSDETKDIFEIRLSQNDSLSRMLLKTCSKNNVVHFTIKPLNVFEKPFAIEMCMRLTGSDGTDDRKIEHVFRDDSPWTVTNPLERKEFAGKGISLFLYLKTKNLIQSNSYTNFDCSNVSIELMRNAPCFFDEETPSADSVTSHDVAVFKKDPDMPEDPVLVLSKELMCVYQDQKFSDINLKCGNVTFPVHKVILSARSLVLDRLLSCDMKEAASGTVEIEDLDPSTLGLFLIFLYTGVVEDLQCDSALKLFYAADKYQVPSLKRECSDFLSANVSISSVCDILSLADRHRDDELTAASLDFILDNYNDVLKSKEWDTLKKNEPLLVANTLTQFAVEGRVRKHQP